MAIDDLSERRRWGGVGIRDCEQVQIATIIERTGRALADIAPKYNDSAV